MDDIKKVAEEIDKAKGSYREMEELGNPFKNLALEEVDIVPIVQPIPKPDLAKEGIKND